MNSAQHSSQFERTAVVTGAGGFIGHHLVKYLKGKGYFVRGVDINYPAFEPTAADEFMTLDLTQQRSARDAVKGMHEVYALAADMGGMGFIQNSECSIMHNSSLININTIDAASIGSSKPRRYFFSSSVCVYRDMMPDEPDITEEAAYPAQPDSEYGWEKLYAERVALAYGRKCGMQIRIARFENTYGPLGAWQGGREKAPAAICRKVARTPEGSVFEVWGDGKAMRVFTYIDDLVEGIYMLMQSDLQGPTNIGSTQKVSVADLVSAVIEVSGNNVTPTYVPGPVGVHARNFSKNKIHSIGWRAKISLLDGIRRTYPWIEDQTRTTKRTNP